MAKALILTSKGSAENFELRDQPQLPVPDDGVRVSVHFSGINFADSLMMLGAYPDAPKLPAAPGYEISGVVTEAGKKSSLKTGDRVAGMTIFGGYADEVVAPDFQMVKLPEALALDAAASLPVNYVTAAIALEEMARIRAGDNVLVHGGAGGVGRLALQIAQKHGATTFATASSEEKLKVAKESGADFCINYRTHDFADEVMRLTSGRGVDCILDPVGGENIKKGVRILSAGGSLVLFGIAAAIKAGKFSSVGMLKSFLGGLKFSPMLLMNRNIGFYGLNVLKYPDRPHTREVLRKHLQRGFELAGRGEIKPLVSKIYPLAEGGKALSDILSGQTTGKLLLKCR